LFPLHDQPAARQRHPIRLGWTGDIQVFTPTANYLFDTSGFLGGWLRDVYADQKDFGGVVPEVVPWMNQNRRTPTAHAITGDKAILEAQWESMVLWLAKGVKRGPDDLWDPDCVQYGDWLDPRAPPEYPAHGQTDTHLAANAYLVYVTGLVARIGKLLGKDYRSFEKDYERLLKLYQANYITAGGRLVSDTQTAFALTLRFGLIDKDDKRRAKLLERLDHLIRFQYFKISTGFAGTPIILDTLAENGMLPLAYRMLQEKDCPSWLYPVGMGATTIWERWDSMLPNGRINPGQMTSFNHYALGSCANFLHTVVGGLSALEPGWKKALIRPQPGGTLTSARTSFDSPYGLYAVEWAIGGGKLKVEVTVPPNTTAVVELGRSKTNDERMTKEVGSGQYSFEVPWTADESWPPTGLPGPQSRQIPDEYVP